MADPNQPNTNLNRNASPKDYNKKRVGYGLC